jgi:Asp-tRNA(Asn)/Glu-tRNA(Gln) amidotransferase A subunit family amidase
MGQDANWFVRQLLKLKFRKDTGGKINLLPSLKKGLSLGFKDYSRVLRRQQECKMELNKIFDRYDFVICPTSAGPAFHHNPKHRPIIMDGKPTHYFDYCFPYAMLYNAMENPVLDFPAGQDSQGLPIGLQIAAPQYAERPLIHFGKMIEKLGYQFRPPV